jgi:hypothetical protein
MIGLQIADCRLPIALGIVEWGLGIGLSDWRLHRRIAGLAILIEDCSATVG